MTHARIGKIRFKVGGAEVQVLHNPSPIGSENWRGTLVKHARSIAEDPDEMAGFLVIGWYMNGSHQCGFRINDAQSPIPRSLLPAYIEEIVRRYAVTKKQVGDMLYEDTTGT